VRSSHHRPERWARHRPARPHRRRDRCGHWSGDANRSCLGQLCHALAPRHDIAPKALLHLPSRRACHGGQRTAAGPDAAPSRAGADLSAGDFIMIGTGMWLALVMACNVWLIIWPNQKTIPGIVGRTAGQKAAAANPRSTRAASTPCSRSRCGIAWSRNRTRRSENRRALRAVSRGRTPRRDDRPGGLRRGRTRSAS
jgi:hypothetical protein